ncbi:MAG: RagB/SusD family nutrient uptake outer membrane protein [Prevotellaceae bacterium]|jgi:hypothetical protein|nr:RagB/SusD family nutrient uptake outer membrane protein [Prevotellaceae bacterium]
MKNLIKIMVCAVVLAGFTSCFKDLDNPPIDPKVTQIFNQDAIFVKVYATLGLTGLEGPAGSGDVDGIDEGTSAFSRMIWELQEFPADDIWWVWDSDAGLPAIRNLSWTSSNELSVGLYYRLYFDITMCNFFLQNTEKETDEKSVKQRAEVRFIRALNYYYLLDMYGEGVPFADKIADVVPMPAEDMPKPKTRVELYTWIETELLAIEPDMFAVGAKTGYFRADQAAVWLLLSRLYLNAEVYTGTANWNKAAEYAGKVMTSSYTLATEYRHLFMGDNDNLSSVNTASSELILPIPQDGIQTKSYGGSLVLIAGSHVNGMLPWGSSEQWECFRAKPTLVKKFFPDLAVADLIYEYEDVVPALAGDDRALFSAKLRIDTAFVIKEENGKKYTLNGQTEYPAGSGLYPKEIDYTLATQPDSWKAATAFDTLPHLTGGAINGSAGFSNCWQIAKFSNLYASGAQSHDPRWTDTDIPFMRAAEAYLTYAEAVLRGGAATNGSAAEAIAALRNRAHATPLPNVTLDDIFDEWSREFYAEGRRRSDLVRFNKFAGAVNYNWEGKGGTADGKDVDAKYNIYPIPSKDLNANPNLTPSEGY